MFFVFLFLILVAGLAYMFINRSSSDVTLVSQGGTYSETDVRAPVAGVRPVGLSGVRYDGRPIAPTTKPIVAPTSLIPDVVVAVVAPLPASSSISSREGNLDQISRIPRGIKELTVDSTVNWTKANRTLGQIKPHSDTNGTTTFYAPIGMLKVKRPDSNSPNKEHPIFGFEIKKSITGAEKFTGTKQEITYKKKTHVASAALSRPFEPPSSGTETFSTTLKFDKDRWGLFPYTSSSGGYGTVKLDYEEFLSMFRTAYVAKDDLADNIKISWKS